MIWYQWVKNACETPDFESIVHLDAFEAPHRWSCASLLNTSLNIAENLMESGINVGDVCALILRHSRYLYPVYMAISLIGAIPAVLAYPNERLHPEKFAEGLKGMSQTSGLDWILTERELYDSVVSLLDREKSSIKGTLFPTEWSISEAHSQALTRRLRKRTEGLNDSVPFILQHSSGTTGLQKAVILSHKAVIEHTSAYSRSLKISQQDKIVSWLPLYHDMGLIAAFHLPLYAPLTLIQIDPFQWVKAPLLLFEAISREKPSITWMPNFAYNLMAERISDDDMQSIDLSSMRMFINCSEPVRAESHQKFLRRFCRSGVKRETLGACYAMAETTFAVTQTEPGKEARELEVNRDLLAQGIVQLCDNRLPTRVCVSSGKPIEGCSINIIDEHGNELPEGFVGEIMISSRSLFDGYRNSDQKTREALSNGWYLSGDLGFLHGQEYYIIGRKKDLIIIAGKNIYPEDIEDALNHVVGVIPGRVVAFGEEDLNAGTEMVSVIVETNHESDLEQKRLKREIIKAGMTIDVTISKVHLMPPRWLIKSSSGKPGRKINKERITGKDNI